MRETLRARKQACIAGGLLFAGLVLGGCGAGVPSPAASATPTASKPVEGRVMGGQQPVAGVALQLYQAGTTGYGSAAIPLGPPVYTTPSGNFTLPSYTCMAGSQVYLAGTGGQPIAATQTSPAITNNNLALMVGLGTCGGTYLNNFINVNELTTVASVWALAPFMTGIANIGTSATNATGLANAFAAINELVTISNGTIPGPTLPAGATLPNTEINTLADILEQCVNSGGGAAGDGSNCGNLFNLAPNAAGTIFPADTVTAAMNIAQNPGRNLAALNALRSASPVFQPALSVNSPPGSWMIAITYAVTAVSLAADGNGNIWGINLTSSNITELDNTGAVVLNSTAGGSSPSVLAIDASGSPWVISTFNNTLTKLNTAGTSGTTYSGNGLNAPESVAIDGNGNVWVANSNSAFVSAFTPSGNPLPGSPFLGAGVSNPLTVVATPK